MKTRKRLSALVPLLILWLLLSMLFWSWIFTFLTDAPRERKIVLFADLYAVEDTRLAGRLEQALPQGFKLVQAHPFSYAMLDSEQLTLSDLFIIRESQMDTYLEWLAPLPEGFTDGALWSREDAAYGLRVYDAETDTGAAASYVTYVFPDGTSENCYLCFGAQSLHLSSGAAQAIARELLTLE